MLAKKSKDTTAQLRSKAVMDVAAFLKKLVDPKQTARIPKELREDAEKLLAHYPTYYDISISSHYVPFIWADVARPVDLVSEWEDAGKK